MIHGNTLRAFHLTGTGVGAVTKSELVHLGHHRTGAAGRFRTSLRKQGQGADTGRYEQLRRYDTFRDSDSVDHAVFSHDIVAEKGWLNQWPDVWRKAVLDAVLFHNRRDLPEGLDAVTLAVSQTVRDADKLDIFRVLEHQIATTDWRHDCKAFWNLPVQAAPSPAVVAAIRDGRPVDYQHIRSLADFVLIQVGWMRSGLAYATSRRLCAERGHLAFRRDFLRQLTDDPAVGDLCDLAGNALSHRQ